MSERKRQETTSTHGVVPFSCLGTQKYLSDDMIEVNRLVLQSASKKWSHEPKTRR